MTPYRVLLIDDSRTMREVLKVYLMGGQYEFVEAESALRALEILRVEQVDLIIADVKMPGMDGIEFLRTVRSNQKAGTRPPPTILITGDKSFDILSRAEEARPDALLHKPLSSDRLVQLVEELLRDRRA
jgi:two-component system chemotaxis response regulator CheY